MQTVYSLIVAVYTSLHAVICPLINANVIGKHVTVIPLGHYQ